ncbi:GatB/YqeY domain-containing protein [Patescibacteria group bacterium]|nr:GatB/YqeY domain-containing protein [Patescibacteria group bacterium]
MTLKEKIRKDFKKILKEKKEIEISTLRMLNAAILNREKKKRYKLSKEKPNLKEKDLEKESQLTDEEIIEVIFSEVKKRKEAIVEFKKGERMDLVEKEKREMEILKKYLPGLLSEEEIKRLAEEIIEEIGAINIKDIGRVMGVLMPKVKGKAEGGLVSKIVKELLGP